MTGDGRGDGEARLDRWEPAPPSSKPNDTLYWTDTREVPPGARTTLAVGGWDRVFLRVLGGKVRLRGREGLRDYDFALATGETVELFPEGWHELSAETADAEVELVAVGPRRPSASRGFDGKGAEGLDLRLGDDGSPRDALGILGTALAAGSLRTESPAFMNQLFAGRTPEAKMALRWSYDLRTTLATREAAPALSRVETETLRAIVRLAGWNEPGDGIAVPGGSAANFMALHVARHRADPAHGGRGASTARWGVFASDQAHYSLEKACSVLGLGTDQLVAVPTDGRGRLRPDALDAAVSAFRASGGTPLLACATAGTTVLGAFDPIAATAEVCRRHGLWLHVDGAWGGPALFSDRARPLMSGIELADSLAFDAHKLLGGAVPASFFVSRHPGLLRQANAARGGAYLFHQKDHAADDEDLGLRSWQCGRGPDALQLWTLWKSVGRRGVGAFVDRLLALRDELLTRINRESRLVLVAEPEFLNVCVQVRPPPETTSDDASAWSLHVRESLRAQNRAMINYARREGRAFLRLILAHPLLQSTDLHALVDALLETR